MTQLNLIVTVGKAGVKENIITYFPETFKNPLGKDERLTSEVKSSITFDNGQISFKVNFKSKNGHCQVILSNRMILIGLNVLNGLYGIAKLNSSTSKYDPVSVTGDPYTFNTEKDYELQIKIFWVNN